MNARLRSLPLTRALISGVPVVMGVAVLLSWPTLSSVGGQHSGLGTDPPVQLSPGTEAIQTFTAPSSGIDAISLVIANYGGDGSGELVVEIVDPSPGLDNGTLASSSTRVEDLSDWENHALFFSGLELEPGDTYEMRVSTDGKAALGSSGDPESYGAGELSVPGQPEIEGDLIFRLHRQAGIWPMLTARHRDAPGWTIATLWLLSVTATGAGVWFLLDESEGALT